MPVTRKTIVSSLFSFQKRNYGPSVKKLKEKHYFRKRVFFKNKEIIPIFPEDSFDYGHIDLVKIILNSSIEEKVERLRKDGMFPCDTELTHAVLSEKKDIVFVGDISHVAVITSHIRYKNREHVKHNPLFFSQIGKSNDNEDNLVLNMKSLELFSQQKTCLILVFIPHTGDFLRKEKKQLHAL